ncbi:energy-coupling factor transporter transmembrane component T family protein [Youngiibacter multivorans]|uniref:Energy-coupling factor transporter transmembrane protein EcfT n=1 Tax=Youngiibacter multivorans TaxID=937251 RepID=A0ABS4G3P0_9CLOT|nr:energy-coupling factor transporter transmembrane component T [Youngiibacter multivorans]MBP1919097.1 energy-coupling factor transport system permease protein [Youngiibacter multivorans]
MIKSITIGQYIPGESFIHKLDPRTKILISLLFIINLFLVKNFVGYVAVFAFIVLMVKVAKLSPKYLYKGIRPVFVLILFTAALNLFVTQGTSETLLVQFSIFKIYREGVYQAMYMTFRLMFLIMGTSVLTLTTSPIELTDGIESLLKPFKRIGVPAHELAMMMSIALRFIPTLMDETDKIMKAQMARGADFESRNLIKKAQSLIPLLVPLFISSFRRAEELAMAMEARSYRGGEGRTRMKQLKYTKRDGVAFASFAVLFAATFALGLTNLI